MNEFKLDFKSRWYDNCKRRRKENAKICESCPFREYIILEEKKYAAKCTREKEKTSVFYK